MKGWPIERSARKVERSQSEPHPPDPGPTDRTLTTDHTLTWTDPKTGLEVRCVAAEYHDFPTVEWTLYFKNTGTSDTPILEQIQALDIQLDRGDTPEFLLHHNRGSPADGNDYGPLETPLLSGQTKRIGAKGDARPTRTGPISTCNGPARFDRRSAGPVSGRPNSRGIRPGPQIRRFKLTRFKLLPGEEVRSPLIVLQF
jgi:alpha-galactosidase